MKSTQDLNIVMYLVLCSWQFLPTALVEEGLWWGILSHSAPGQHLLGEHAQPIWTQGKFILKYEKEMFFSIALFVIKLSWETGKQSKKFVYSLIYPILIQYWSVFIFTLCVGQICTPSYAQHHCCPGGEVGTLSGQRGSCPHPNLDPDCLQHRLLSAPAIAKQEKTHNCVR